MDAAAERRLERLLQYVEGCRQAATQAPARAADIHYSARGYASGTLETLRALDLLSQEEWREWLDRLAALLDDVPK
jgi:hypothetical protein